MLAASNKKFLAPGFQNPVDDAQVTFRATLDAMAKPGSIFECGSYLAPSAPMSPAAAAFLLTMADFETPVWLDAPLLNSAASAWIKFHCSVPISETPATAAFAVVSNPANLPPLSQFNLGSNDYPERSTTVIVDVDGLSESDGVRLSGPGINGETRLTVDGLSKSFWAEWSANGDLFPRGIDLLLTSADRLAALPRTTKVKV